MNTARTKLMRFFTGFSPATTAILANASVLERELLMKCLAIVLGAAAFAFGVFQFVHHVLEQAFAPSLVFGASAGGGLLALEWFNLNGALYATGRGKRFYLTRVAVVVVMGLASFFAAIGPMKTSIDANLKKVRQEKVESLSQTAHHQAKLAAADVALERAKTDATRQAELKRELTDLDAKIASAKAEENNERLGNIDSKGVQRLLGCGPKCRGWQAQGQQLADHRKAVHDELGTLGGAQQTLRDAVKAQQRLREDIEQEADALISGATLRVEAMFDLLSERWDAKFIMLFYLALALLPEALAWQALSPVAERTGEVMQAIRDIEHEGLEQALLRHRADTRDQFKPQPLDQGVVFAHGAVNPASDENTLNGTPEARPESTKTAARSAAKPVQEAAA